MKKGCFSKNRPIVLARWGSHVTHVYRKSHDTVKKWSDFEICIYTLAYCVNIILLISCIRARWANWKRRNIQTKLDHKQFAVKTKYDPAERETWDVSVLHFKLCCQFCLFSVFLLVPASVASPSSLTDSCDYPFFSLILSPVKASKCTT